MKKYYQPRVELIVLKNDDVIAMSGTAYGVGVNEKTFDDLGWKDVSSLGD